LRSDTILVSVMYVNNETGVIQPIKQIAELAHKSGALFMTDATQAVGKISLNVNDDAIDILCFSGHKLYAPKGIGCLYLKQMGVNKVKLSTLIHGGGHERGLRSGTLNVPGIVAVGKACELAGKEMKANAEKIAALREHLESGLLRIKGTSINGSPNERLYNVTNICFSGIDSDALIMGLSEPDIDSPMVAVSNGSACTSTSIEPSHVLVAMGLDKKRAFNCIRFSLGQFNTMADIDSTVKAVLGVIVELKAFSSD
jgi:cysteine desulfurase